MTLRTELVQTQFEEGHHLAAKFISRFEALRVEHDASDHVFVRLHHRHHTEELLQVVRKLGSACVRRVHRNEDAHVGVKLDITTHEIDAFLQVTKTRLDREDLLRDSGEHTLFKSIELIEATPGADLAETDEDATHRVAIERLITVKDEDEATELGAQGLHRFSLTGTGGPERRATHAPV